MGTVVVVARALKVFKKGAIIVTRKKIATIAVKIFKKSNAASFNKKEKYIQINSDTAASA